MKCALHELAQLVHRFADRRIGMQDTERRIHQAPDSVLGVLDVPAPVVPHIGMRGLQHRGAALVRHRLEHPPADAGIDLLKGLRNRLDGLRLQQPYGFDRIASGDSLRKMGRRAHGRRFGCAPHSIRLLSEAPNEVIAGPPVLSVTFLGVREARAVAL